VPARTVLPQLRVARSSNDIEATARFYMRGLELEVMARFEDHDGFDGVIVGRAEWPYHLEFTRHRSQPRVPQPTDEELLVLYIPDCAQWTATVQRFLALGAVAAPSSNPYWNRNGVTFEDPDGYRIVLQNSEWP
jgi:catechol 2,3-dioxygenase-like lactoylglutathione lyase family enzyme